MNNNDINSAWAAVAPTLQEFSFADIKSIAKLAGFTLETLQGLGLDSNNWHRENSDMLVSDLENHFLKFPNEEKHRFLSIVINLILSGRFNRQQNTDDNLEERLQQDLNQLG